MEPPASKRSLKPGHTEGSKMKNRMITTVATFLVAVASLTALAASAFEGVWKVKDTAGQSFQITLSNGGAAKANAAKE